MPSVQIPLPEARPYRKPRPQRRWVRGLLDLRPSAVLERRRTRRETAREVAQEMAANEVPLPTAAPKRDLGLQRRRELSQITAIAHPPRPEMLTAEPLGPAAVEPIVASETEGILAAARLEADRIVAEAHHYAEDRESHVVRSAELTALRMRHDADQRTRGWCEAVRGGVDADMAAYRMAVGQDAQDRLLKMATADRLLESAEFLVDEVAAVSELTREFDANMMELGDRATAGIPVAIAKPSLALVPEPTKPMAGLREIALPPDPREIMRGA